jgi:hypothetical protein
LIPEGGGVGAAYFHNRIDGDIFGKIKPRVWGRVYFGVICTPSDLHQTIDFIGRSRCIHFLEENPKFP